MMPLTEVLNRLGENLHPFHPGHVLLGARDAASSPGALIYTSHAARSDTQVVYVTVKTQDIPRCPNCPRLDNIAETILGAWPSTSCPRKGQLGSIINCGPSSSEYDLCDDLGLNPPGIYLLESNPFPPLVHQFEETVELTRTHGLRDAVRVTNIPLSKIYGRMNRGEIIDAEAIEEIRNAITLGISCPVLSFAPFPFSGSSDAPLPSQSLSFHIQPFVLATLFTLLALLGGCIVRKKSDRTIQVTERAKLCHQYIQLMLGHLFAITLIILYLIGASGLPWSLLVQWKWPGIAHIIPSRNAQYASEPFIVASLLFIAGVAIGGMTESHFLWLIVALIAYTFLIKIKIPWWVGSTNPLDIWLYTKLEMIPSILFRLWTEMNDAMTRT